jgi:hypothetical protein
VKRAGGWEIHTACWYHGEDPQARGRLYINTDPEAEIPGLHECKVCGAHGSLVSIKKHFGDAVEQKDEDYQSLRGVLEDAAEFYHQQLGDHEEAFMWLRGPERMLTTDTIVDHKLGYAAGGLYSYLRSKGHSTADQLKTGLVMEDKATNKIVDSLRNMVTIPYFVAGNCVMIRGRAWPHDKDSKGPKYKTCGGNTTRLYNSDAAWETDEIVITEGEFDALVMKQLGYKAVGVPGARTWQDSWDGYMATMKRIWLVFDRDVAGEQGAEKLRERFGHRVKRVMLSQEGQKKDPTMWVAEGNTAQDFQDLLEQAAKGGLLVSVAEARQEHSEVQGLDGLKLGFDLLDTMIEPGLLPSQVMVVLAKAGTGKTLFLLNLMQRMSMVEGQEELPFLFVSLEQTRGEWWERARRIYSFYNPEGNGDAVEKYWQDRLMLVDKNRVSENELHVILDDYEYRMGRPPACTFIDYLGYWAQGFKGERYERTSDAIMALKSVGKDRRIPIITPHQVSRIAKYGEEPDTDAARDAGVVEETADFLFTLWSPDAQLGRNPEEKQGIVSMRIGKSRHGGRGTKIDLQFAPLSLALVPVGADRYAKAAKDELHWEIQYNDKWAHAVYRHRTGFEGSLNNAAQIAAEVSSAW